MEKLLTSLFSSKGATGSYRTVLIGFVVYVAMKANEIDRRLAVLEQRAGIGIVATTPPK